MGEIADMMIDGTLCGGCGCYLDDSGGEGFQRFCGICLREMNTPVQQKYSGPPQPVGEKQRKLLIRVRDNTDTFTGAYPGLHWEDAAAQLSKLEARGFVEIYRPHNPAHKTRAIITDAGRAAIS